MIVERNALVEIAPGDVVVDGECGTHAFMYRGEGLAVLREAFGREGIAAKIHHQPLRNHQSLSEYVWGTHYLPPHQQTPILEAITIQNLCAIHGLAPRVYGLALWRDRYGRCRPVQVTDDMGHCNTRKPTRVVSDLHAQLVELGGRLGFIPNWNDGYVAHVVGGKWVDFQSFFFAPDYEPRLMARFWAGTMFGDRPYQQVLSGSSMPTCRVDMTARIADLGLDALDFTPRTVCDIGCSGGQFLNYLTQRYGARGTGYDLERVVNAAREYSVYAGAWNVDYVAADLRQPDTVTGAYDLVLFLSMAHHVGFPAYVLRAARKRLIVEVIDDQQQQAREWLAGEFSIVREHRSFDYKRLVLHAERCEGAV